ncbi:hypothetical protein ADIARSV_1212 [Arcticibacter svalbardensis MN12-7]|uniref:Uncharacterized protein n=1 Tax=Arcticibacter svalbardensis MN12-7 TaxID=1150600 RepID=R9GV63_9SPHI|nr:hypothetical protein ADIARSV_1212 [Arcticibacter svalbardensis MN12-7]
MGGIILCFTVSRKKERHSYNTFEPLTNRNGNSEVFHL